MTAETAAPLSFQQLRLWLMNQLDPASSAYNLLLAVRLRGEVDDGALLAALTRVLRAQPALRTGYLPGRAGDEPVQVVRDATEDLLRAMDRPARLVGADSAADDAAVAAAVTDRLNRPFNLADATPPVRLGYYRLGADDRVLALCMHHIAFDAASGALVLDQLAACYAAAAGTAGSGSADSAAPDGAGAGSGYADYARAQRSSWDPERVADAARFWRSELGEAELSPLASPAAVRSAGVRRFGFRLGAAEAARITVTGERTGTSLFAVSLAMVLCWVALYTGCRWPTVGVPVSCRDEATEGTVGCFINTLLVGCEVRDGDALIDVVERARAALARAVSYRDFPLEKVLESLGRPPTGYRGDIPSILLTVNDATAGRWRLGSASATLLGAPPAVGQVDLSIAVQAADGELECWFDLRGGAVGGWHGAGIAGQFRVLFRTLALDPGAALAGIDLMTAAERASLLALWNGAGR
jgi:hypothetical protein